MPFNEDKCKVIHFGRHNPNYSYLMNNTELNTVDKERDLGVTFDPNLSFVDHVADITKRANMKLGMIKRSFRFLKTKGLMKLYKAIVRPTLEYCNVVYSPNFKREEDLLEKVQQRATRMFSEFSHLPYEDRLRALNLPTLIYRRQRADIHKYSE